MYVEREERARGVGAVVVSAAGHPGASCQSRGVAYHTYVSITDTVPNVVVLLAAVSGADRGALLLCVRDKVPGCIRIRTDGRTVGASAAFAEADIAAGCVCVYRP